MEGAAAATEFLRFRSSPAPLGRPRGTSGSRCSESTRNDTSRAARSAEGQEASSPAGTALANFGSHPAARDRSARIDKFARSGKHRLR